MTQVIWSLMLTVCSTETCATQSIQWFEEMSQCQEMKVVHEELPVDGPWKSVVYDCTIVGAEKA